MKLYIHVPCIYIYIYIFIDPQPVCMYMFVAFQQGIYIVCIYIYTHVMRMCIYTLTYHICRFFCVYMAYIDH